MSKKLGVSKSEMLELRNSGLSNDDIANVLEISRATVFRYIGPQGGRMEKLAAFEAPKEKEEETPMEEVKPTPRAVDTLTVAYEILRSANGTFRAEVDHEDKCVIIGGNTYGFDTLAELATFIVGLAGRVERKN